MELSFSWCWWEKSLRRSGRTHFSPCVYEYSTLCRTRRPWVPWVSWILDERQLPIISLLSLLWSNCLPSPMRLSNNLPNNCEFKCEQNHEYTLLLLSWPGSSRQSSFEYLQLHLTSPSTIHGETSMNQNTSRMNTILPRLLRVRFFWSFDFRSQQDFHVTFHPSRNALANLLKKHCHASLRRSIFIVSVGGIKKSNYSQPFCEWREFKSHWLRLELSRQLVSWELSHHQLLEKLLVKHIWKSCSNTQTVSFFVTNLSVPEVVCTFYAL